MSTFKPLLVIIVAVAVAAGAAVFLTRRGEEPASQVPRTLSQEFEPGGGHFRGPESARVTLVEFGDYQCPSCAYYHPIVAELLRRYPKDLRLEFHHFPLIQIHPYAMAAALAAEAAGEQGRYWEMHDLLFEQQQTWSQSRNAEQEFLSFAAHIGLNSNSFMQSMRAPALQQRVLEDVVRARDAKVNEVPTFFIKGRRIPTPQTVDAFSAIIAEELRANP